MIAGLHWESFGPADGPPLILSAGLGGGGGYWKPNLAALAQDRRVILYDHRGTGRSDRTLGAATSIEAMADDLVALMDGLDIARADMIGHALGGIIGLALALRAPDRIGGLVAVNSWSKPDPHFARCFDIRLQILRDSGPSAYLRAQPLFLYPAPWISRNIDRIEAEEAHHLADFQGVDTLAKRVAAICAFDIDARLGEIAAPVLALAAEDDMLVPAFCSERLAEGLPHATLAQLPGGGHACNITEAAAFEDIVLGWLDHNS
jgi:aminoacrylate hydrolase